MLSFRFRYGKASDAGLPYLIFLMLKRNINKALMVQGYGKHSKEEGKDKLIFFSLENISYFFCILVLEIGKSDLRAVERFIGNNKYLFGNNPCVEDAVIFSFTTQTFYQDSGPLNEFLISKIL